MSVRHRESWGAIIEDGHAVCCASWATGGSVSENPRGIGGSGITGRRPLAVFAALVTSLWLLLPASTVFGQEGNVPVMIQTVPKLQGIRFALSGHTFTSDKHGLALTTVPHPGTYQLQVMGPKTFPPATRV